MPEGHARVIRELIIPVFRFEKVVAILGVGNKPSDYTESDLKVVELLADLAWDIYVQKNSQEELDESRRWRDQIIENAPFGAHHFQLNSDGKLVFTGANDAADQMLKTQHGELIGKTFEAAFPPLSHTDLCEKYRSVAETGTPYFSEQVEFRRGQFSAVFEVHAFQTLPNCMTAFFQDITQRKLSELALQESEARVRRKLQNILSPNVDLTKLELSDIIDVEAIQSILDEVNKLTHVPAAIIDLKGKVVIGTGWQNICTKFHRVHPETLLRCIECDTVLTQNVKPGEFKAYLCKNNLWDCVTPLLVNGQHVGNLFTGQFFLENEVPDISVFKEQAATYGFDEEQYLEALKEVPIWSRKYIDTAFRFYLKLTSMFTSLTHANVALAGTLEKLRINEAGMRALVGLLQFRSESLQEFYDYALFQAIQLTGSKIGYIHQYNETRKEFMLKSCSNPFLDVCDIPSPDSIRKLEKSGLWGEVIRQRKPVIVNDYRAESPLKRGYPAEHTPIERFLSIPVFSRDQIVGVIGLANKETDYTESDVLQVSIMMDTVWKVTDQRRAEIERETMEVQLQQAQKMESVGRLAGGVAHDFNNMLGVIIGHAEMSLARLENNHPIRSELTEIQHAAKRSADLTRQLLAFARKQTVMPKVLNLNDTIISTLNMLRRMIGEDIELHWLPYTDLWLVNIDPSQVDQILANLCVNARDAIVENGKITIETSNVTIDEESKTVLMSAETGNYVKISVSDNGIGMDAETQKHIFEPFFTTKEIGKGTGLGLATVYIAVKQNDGFVSVYSELGIGTTFSIYLPRYEAKPDETKSDGLSERDRQGKETILLVEDEPSILRMTKTILESYGYNVIATESPSHAIEIHQAYSGEIHLLITDIVMPEMNGKELARRLLSGNPKLKRLFMSGYTADIIARQGVLDETIDFIQKPFTMKEISTKVREILDRK